MVQKIRRPTIGRNLRGKMTLDIEPIIDQKNLKPSINVMGVGGAGSNAVNNMINSNLEGVNFAIANTDAQALQSSNCKKKLIVIKAKLP